MYALPPSIPCAEMKHCNIKSRVNSHTLFFLAPLALLSRVIKPIHQENIRATTSSISLMTASLCSTTVREGRL
jgi:hypothetical protein